jgi:hypothetical protein
MFCPGFESILRFIYSSNKSIIAGIQDLSLLFEIYHLGDKVCNKSSQSLVVWILDRFINKTGGR